MGGKGERRAVAGIGLGPVGVKGRVKNKGGK